MITDQDAAVGTSAAERPPNCAWAFRERRKPEAAGFLGVPIKLDVLQCRFTSHNGYGSRPPLLAAWPLRRTPEPRLSRSAMSADGNDARQHIVPAATDRTAATRDAVFSFVASARRRLDLRRARHRRPEGVMARTGPHPPPSARLLFARIRAAFDPSGTPRTCTSSCPAYVPERSAPLGHQCGPGRRPGLEPRHPSATGPSTPDRAEWLVESSTGVSSAGWLKSKSPARLPRIRPRLAHRRPAGRRAAVGHRVEPLAAEEVILDELAL